ncbi:MAG: GNAT family N-acetyltransferase [Rubripirellula sp.]|nr:GNAT family N-acetyltransferase [Rubripirellula sp.]
MSQKKKPPPATRQPSGFQFSIADRIDFLNPEHWDHVTRHHSVFLDRRYLANAQQEFCEQIIRNFAIVYEHGNPIAAVATQTFDVDGTQLISAKPSDSRTPTDHLKRKSLSMIKRRIMLCGNVHTWGPHGVAFAQGISESDAWRGVADCLYRIRRANRLHGQVDYVIVKDLFESDGYDPSPLEPFRYRSLETEPNMVLHLHPEWRSMDDYLASLTKRYRAAAKKVLKPFQAGDLKISPVTNLGDEKDRLFELYQAVASKADVCLFGLSESTLPKLSTALGEDFATIGIRRGDSLIGFVTMIRDGDTAIGFYLGMDYEENAQLPIYHALLLSVIDKAIQWSCKTISFGRTALEAKSRLGCKPETTTVWIRHRVPLLNMMVQQILKNVHHQEPPQRNPFKELA